MENIRNLLEEVRKPVCSECNQELESLSAAGTPQYLMCCEKCKPIKHIKENWKPMGAGKVYRIFRV